MIAALVLALALDAPPQRPDLLLRTPDLTMRVKDKKGNLVRSRGRRALFLRMVGHENGRVPNGYAADHWIPLTCGGADAPANLQLLTIDEWKKKSRWERQPCSAWWDGTNARLLQYAIDGCATGRTPKELCR